MNEHFYETGSTQPPKSRIIIVFCLMLLIFVGGIVTALNILNVSLWETFSSRKETVSVKFTREENSQPVRFPAPQETADTPAAGLGIGTETVSAFARAYYQLPQGVFIPQVPAGSHAAIAGILPGDILLSLDEHPVTDTDTLNKLLHRYHAGDVVSLTLYRDAREISIELTLTEEN